MEQHPCERQKVSPVATSESEIRRICTPKRTTTYADRHMLYSVTIDLQLKSSQHQRYAHFKTCAGEFGLNLRRTLLRCYLSNDLAHNNNSTRHLRGLVAPLSRASSQFLVRPAGALPPLRYESGQCSRSTVWGFLHESPQRRNHRHISSSPLNWARCLFRSRYKDWRIGIGIM